MGETFDLQRFVEAQERVYADVLLELKRGIKAGHWIWYVFPQIKDIGSSAMSLRYSISSIDEARAYCEHPVLGPRLVECTELVMAVEGRTIEDIFGYPDFLKFRSCMTLFAKACDGESIYQRALDRYFEGVPDPLTIDVLLTN